MTNTAHKSAGNTKKETAMKLLKEILIQDMNVIFGVLIVGAMTGALLNTIFVVSGL
jgi:cell division GTPase FtsZ